MGVVRRSNLRLNGSVALIGRRSRFISHSFMQFPLSTTAVNKPIDPFCQENALRRAEFAADLRAGCEKLGV